MQNHTCDPGGGYTDDEQTADLHHGTVHSFTAGAEISVDDVVSGWNGARSQVDHDHVLTVLHGLRSQTK